MTEKYRVVVRLAVEVDVVNDSSSIGMIEGYVTRHLRNLPKEHSEMARNRVISAVVVDYCKGQQV